MPNPGNRGFLPAIAFLLAASAHSAERSAAAVVLQHEDATLHFEDGTMSDRHFRRAGIEYREGVTEYIDLGFAIGRAESEGREAARPFEAVPGRYGALIFRLDVPLANNVDLHGRVDYLLQRDDHDTVERSFEVRTREAGAQIGPRLRFGRFDVSLGASWRDIDYRETVREAGGENLRRARSADRAGGFAALALHTDDTGVVALRYGTGADDGWTLRFERTFE